nr:hypothetical protein [Tanacetum cinerariifolium]
DDDDEDPEEDPVDYPADGGDDGDDEDESSEDEKDDETDVEADEEEEDEEEHPAPADFVVFAPTASDQAPSAEETEPFETDESAATPPPHPAYRTTARISIPALKRLGIALSPRYKVGESSSAAAARPAGDTDEIYMRLDDEQTERQLLAGRLNMLFKDRRAHAYTHHLMETEARMSREAWGLAGGPTQSELPEEAGSGS